MGMLEAAVVASGTAAVLLLGGESPRRRSLRRLHRLGAYAPARPASTQFHVRSVLLLWGLPCVPALALLFVAGPMVAGLVGMPTGLALRWQLARRARRTGSRSDHARMLAGLPIATDLLVAGLRAGGMLDDVLASVADAIGGPLGRSLRGVAEQLRLGTDPQAAWSCADGPEALSALGRALERASDSGAPVAAILERHAAEIRDTTRIRALARTQRLGVLIAAPLGLCFLPAFVLIGVVPLAAGLVLDLALP